MNNYYVAVSDITFYLYDEDGNAKADKSGNEITYRLKDGIRYKPLEYIADGEEVNICLLYTSPSPRDGLLSRMPSSA